MDWKKAWVMSAGLEWAALPQAVVTFSLDPACGWSPHLSCIFYLPLLVATQDMFSSRIVVVQGPGQTTQAHLQLLKVPQPLLIHWPNQVSWPMPKSEK